MFFELDRLVDGIVGPIPQKVGLLEYKIPEGATVRIYDQIKL